VRTNPSAGESSARPIAPQAKQARIQGQRVAGKTLRLRAFGEVPNPQDVPLQMRPTQLRLPLLIFEVGPIAVTAQDTFEDRAQQMDQHLGAARTRYDVENEKLRDQRPQVPPLAIRAPAGLVAVEDRFLLQLLFQFLAGLGHGGADLLP